MPPRVNVGQVRASVLIRDGRCMAPMLDPKGAGVCRDAWGALLDYPTMLSLEMHYVRRDAAGKHHQLAGDHVALCAGHHRGTGAQGGYIWATSHAEVLRGYLNRMAATRLP